MLLASGGGSVTPLVSVVPLVVMVTVVVSLQLHEGVLIGCKSDEDVITTSGVLINSEDVVLFISVMADVLVTISDNAVLIMSETVGVFISDVIVSKPGKVVTFISIGAMVITSFGGVVSKSVGMVVLKSTGVVVLYSVAETVVLKSDGVVFIKLNGVVAFALVPAGGCVRLVDTSKKSVGMRKSAQEQIFGWRKRIGPRN